MESYSSSHELSDEATSANTALLSECHRPENVAKNRILCRENGIPDGAQELRRLQHFVSQAIIKLLTKHNITQKDGRPYVASCPKGFLQGPNVWLMDRGFYLSGWPSSGLPTGSISIWPAYFTFALAVMFIRGTITLKPLSLEAGPLRGQQRRRQQDVPLAKKTSVRQAKKIPKATEPSNREPEIASKETVKVNIDIGSRVRSDSHAILNRLDHYSAPALKPTMNDSNVASTSKGVVSTAKESEEQSSSAGPERITSFSDSSRYSVVSSFPRAQRPLSASTTHPSSVKSGSSAMRDTQSIGRLSKKSAEADAGRGGGDSSSSLFLVPAGVDLDAFSSPHTLETFGLPFSPDVSTGVVPSSTGTDYGPADAWRKRRAPALELSYPGVPANATIDWIPPTSAARETKRYRWV
ncbi:hypothetical protein M0805_003939 [Coniferiporia weirii]|nr:hypothetical protein M0805_003939 [Coniferiporia weirii]